MLHVRHWRRGYRAHATNQGKQITTLSQSDSNGEPSSAQPRHTAQESSLTHRQDRRRPEVDQGGTVGDTVILFLLLQQNLLRGKLVVRDVDLVELNRGLDQLSSGNKKKLA